MRPILLDIDPANVSLDAILNGADTSSTGAVTLNGTDLTAGAWVSADGFAHLLSFLDMGSDDQSNMTFEVVGTDAEGRAQTEVGITGPAVDATVESTKYFLTVTGVTVAGTPIASGTTDMGFVDQLATRIIAMDWRAQNAPVIAITETGTAAWTLQFTNDDIQNCFKAAGYPGALDAPFRRTDQNSLLWINDANIAASSASEISVLSTWPVQGIRMLLDSYTDTAELQVHITQSAHNAY